MIHECDAVTVSMFSWYMWLEECHNMPVVCEESQIIHPDFWNPVVSLQSAVRIELNISALDGLPYTLTFGIVFPI